MNFIKDVYPAKQLFFVFLFISVFFLPFKLTELALYQDPQIKMMANWLKAEEAALKDIELNIKEAERFRRKYETVASWRLDREYDLYPVSAKHYQQIDKVIDLIIQKLEEKKKALQWEKEIEWAKAVVILSTIDAVLRESIYKQHQELYFLAQGIDLKKMDCQILATVYMAAAEVLNLPLGGVIIPGSPGHIFIRWQTADGKYLNWDPVSGIFENDQYYFGRWHVQKEDFRIVKLEDWREIIKRTSLFHAYDRAEEEEKDFSKKREYSLKKYAVLK